MTSGPTTSDERILVVGAGFAGAVYARVLAERGFKVCVIDKRTHIAGNAYDKVTPEGVRMHCYGPHLFHTANKRVLDFIKSYGRWIENTHRVKTLLSNGACVPTPINLDTINLIFSKRFQCENEVQKHLERISLKLEAPRNAAEYLQSRIGVELTDIFFRPYSRTMWGIELEELAASVVNRVPLRLDRTDTYFPLNQTQLLPKKGYAAFFENLLDHSNITINLGTAFDHKAMLSDVCHCFASLPIDEFFGFRYGHLKYRSIRFHHRTTNSEPQPWVNSDDKQFATLLFSDSGRFTRETAWHRLPCHIVSETGMRIYTKEEPCDDKDNAFERYYPVKFADKSQQARYDRYAGDAVNEKKITFIGRCGTYQYLDMDQVISQSLSGAHAWVSARRKS